MQPSRALRRLGGMRSLVPLLAIVTPLVFLVGACTVIGSKPPLDGRTFLSVDVTENGAARPLVPGTRVALRFEDGRTGASAGCNTMGGTYTLDGDRIRIDGAAMTEMGCDPERHDQDDWLFGFLGSGPRLTLSGNDLVLTSGGTTIRLVDREIAEPDLPLVRTTWTVTTIVVGGTASSLPAEVVASLEFTDDGRVSVETGCNSGGGTYQVDGSTLRFGVHAMTERACAGPAGQVEAAVLAALAADTVAFEIDADTLTLVAGDNGLGLTGAGG